MTEKSLFYGVFYEFLKNSVDFCLTNDGKTGIYMVARVEERLLC